jgi:rhodanese-related sulfurtransferase
VNPETLAAKRDEYIVLDVRSPEELVMADIGDVVNIPLSELPNRWTELPTDKPIATLCHHGVRSQQAALFLQAHGLDAESVAGGIDAWSLVVDDSVRRY